MSTHYVVEINIKAVTKPPSATNGRPRPAGEPEREVDDVTRVVFKGDDLNDVIVKTIRHLQLETSPTIIFAPDEDYKALTEEFKKAVSKEDEWRE